MAATLREQFKATDHPVWIAGRDAMIGLDLPITDAAFQMLDGLAAALADWYSDMEEDFDPQRWADHAADWKSGSSPAISVYTGEQAQMYTDLAAWHACYEPTYVPDGGWQSASNAIGDELSIIVYMVAATMGFAIPQMVCATCSGLHDFDGGEQCPAWTQEGE